MEYMLTRQCHTLLALLKLTITYNTHILFTLFSILFNEFVDWKLLYFLFVQSSLSMKFSCQQSNQIFHSIYHYHSLTIRSMRMMKLIMITSFTTTSSQRFRLRHYSLHKLKRVTLSSDKSMRTYGRIFLHLLITIFLLLITCRANNLMLSHKRSRESVMTSHALLLSVLASIRMRVQLSKSLWIATKMARNSLLFLKLCFHS